MTDWFSQSAFDVRFEWGPVGLESLLPVDAVVVVDVLRFTTAVCVGVEAGVRVVPWRWDNRSAEAHADAHGYLCSDTGSLLSPGALASAGAGTTVVLPSPNGSTCAVIADEAGVSTVVAGCLRNAAAVGAALAERSSVAVVACGERWRPDGSLRPSLEDLLGAGAVIAALPSARRRSPEAAAAEAVFRATADVAGAVAACGSGVEALDRGWADDVAVAGAVDASSVVPVLRNGAFEAAISV